MNVLGVLKFYITRSMGYLAIINTFLLVFLTLKDYDLPLFVVVFGVGGCLGLAIFFGWLETQLGVVRADVEMGAINNPILMDIHKKICGEKKQ